MYRLDYHKKVIKFLAKQDLKFREKVLDIFDEIALQTMISNPIKLLKTITTD